jgi:hypothetical protein
LSSFPKGVNHSPMSALCGPTGKSKTKQNLLAFAAGRSDGD